MMNLATPAPRVDKATADRAPSPDTAVADAARPSESVRVEKPEAVEPAVAGRKETVIEQPQAKRNEMSVQALRGETGADFESKAAVLRGAPKKDILKQWLPFVFDERDFVAYGETLRFVLIKGDCCFVFADQHEAAPLYAIPLDEVYPVLEDPKNPDKNSVTISPTVSSNMSKEEMVTVLLKYQNNGSQAYQFTFDTHSDKAVAKRFFETVERSVQSKMGGPVRASVIRAKNEGAFAAKAQPMK